MDPATMVAIGTIASNVGAGVMNSMGQANANKRGVKLAHEQMDWNERMMLQQNDAQMRMSKELRDEDREYSSPSAQLQRLRDAGLNPLFYNLDGTGNGMMPQPSAASANAASLPHIDNPLQGVSQGISQAAVTAAQVANINADTKKKEAETAYQQILTEIQSATKDNVVKLSGLEVQLTEGNIQEQQKRIAEIEQHIRESESNIRTQYEQLGLKRQELAIQEMANKIQEYIAKNNFDIQNKQIAVAWANARINDFRAKLEEQGVKANVQYLDLQGNTIRLSNEIREAEFEAKKPLLKFDAYVDSANGVIQGVTGVIGGVIRGAALGSLNKGKKGIHTTESYGANGEFTGSTRSWYEFPNQ